LDKEAYTRLIGVVKYLWKMISIGRGGTENNASEPISEHGLHSG